ncbi:MAG: HEAT repeat domain-containing protein [Eubacteriales bacterium]|nr:HEAT repeat domain-containing protein [Eubacteriales bacterium]
MKRVIGGFLAVVVLLGLVFFGSKSHLFSIGFNQPVYTNSEGISCISRVVGDRFQILDARGKWQDSFLAGVNIGLALPGFFPGEYAIEQSTYFAWFIQIAQMGANVIRVYTPQAPGFYQALYEFNRLAATPLYLLQGVYMDESDVQKYADVFSPDSIVIRDMRQDIIDCINILHGNAVILEVPGKASGIYRYDVSDYVIGWILGIECDAGLVNGTNASHPDITSFEGEYVYARDVAPFEVFIAQMKELAISYETEHYRMQRPIAFTNWVTTDPLSHPNEPDEKEDSAQIDVERIKAKDSFLPGFFASYHVYPYYPDFLRYPSGDPETDANPYLAYLKTLVDYHAMPVLISEFGLPGSRGVTHVNDLTGLSQGGLSEQQVGQGLVSMLDDIRSSGCMGGVVFSWQDEWFKRSWNTMDFDDANTRPQWHNAQSSEVNFGLIAYEAFPSIQIDGKDGDWAGSKDLAGDGSLLAAWDEAFLYLRVEPDNFAKQKYIIPIDTIPGQGSAFYEAARFERDADFVLILDGKSNTRLLLDPYYDPNNKLYGQLMYRPKELAVGQETGKGVFTLARQVISGELHMPATGQTVSPQFWDTGRLIYGNSNPDSDEYDSRADFSEGDGFVEMRIPWMLLNFADPSSRRILDDFHGRDGFPNTTIQEVFIGFGRAGDSRPIGMQAYRLPQWSITTAEQRLKRSYDLLSAAFPKYPTYPINTSSEMQEALRLMDRRLLYVRFEQAVKASDFVLILLGLSLLLAIYLFLLLLGINIHLNASTHKEHREWEHLRSLLWQPKEEIEKKLHRDYLCTRVGFAMLSRFLAVECVNCSNSPLVRVLHRNGCEPCLSQLLHSKDITQCILAIRVAGFLALKQHNDHIVKLMEKNRDNLELLYAGFMAISMMGLRGKLVSICGNLGHTQKLSFRRLKEILGAYTGDKARLYKDLLSSPDLYIRRIAIKNIGDEGFVRLAGCLLPLLETEDDSLQHDLIRSFGQLRFAPAGKYIAKAMDSTSWTLRSIAVKALASIDARTYLPQLVQGLRDRDWGVRLNSAKELSRRIPEDELRALIPGLNDRYAAEILAYAIMEEKLLESGKTGQ